MILALFSSFSLVFKVVKVLRKEDDDDNDNDNDDDDALTKKRRLPTETSARRKEDQDQEHISLSLNECGAARVVLGQTKGLGECFFWGEKK